MRPRSSSAWFQYHKCFSKCLVLQDFCSKFSLYVWGRVSSVWSPLMLHISKLSAVFHIKNKWRKRVIFWVSEFITFSLKHFYMSVNVYNAFILGLDFLISRGPCLWAIFIRKLSECICACTKCAFIYISVEWGGGRQCPLCS